MKAQKTGEGVVAVDGTLTVSEGRALFGEEWPRTRVFPTQTVPGGETVEFGGASFTVLGLGPGRVAARQHLVARR